MFNFNVKKETVFCCGRCYYWVKDEEDKNGDIGECCIRSVPADDFPRRFDHEWCGEFIHSDWVKS